MDLLHVPFIKNVDDKKNLIEIALQMNELGNNILAHAPWLKYQYKPNVGFVLAHNNKSIFLKYYVEEKEIRALNNKINSPVYEDTCVEFFIAFDETGYYNFEFNCIGTCLVGFGKNKYGRAELPTEIIEKISCQAIITNVSESNLITWELTIEIPNSIFINHAFSSLSSLNAKANFYKCGDLLAEPHFLAWSNIESSEPNFHLPQFFGDIYFV